MTMQEHMAGIEGGEGGGGIVQDHASNDHARTMSMQKHRWGGGGPGRGRGTEAALRGNGDELGHSFTVLPGQPLQHLIHLPLHHQHHSQSLGSPV